MPFLLLNLLFNLLFNLNLFLFNLNLLFNLDQQPYEVCTVTVSFQDEETEAQC